MQPEIIQIKAKQTDNTLANGQRDVDVQLFEGAWYFEQTAVDMTHLEISERTYICPYKGICYWIDLALPGHGRIQDIAFTYFQTNPGYEFIQDKIGFYYGDRDATYQKTSPIPT